MSQGATRKIDLMHQIYGYGSGTCEHCPHFSEKLWHRAYNKCLVYGDSNSEATDWRKGYIACGLIDKPFPEGDRRIVELVIARRQDEAPIPGQITMEELL